MVRKYIFANSIEEVLRLDKVTQPNDVWVDQEYERDRDGIVLGFRDNGNKVREGEGEV